jgi:hypothetical protein
LDKQNEKHTIYISHLVDHTVLRNLLINLQNKEPINSYKYIILYIYFQAEEIALAYAEGLIEHFLNPLANLKL